jgi:hypothetical protein
MALSNWDRLAIGSDGKFCEDGRIVVNGRFVELYKNWLYVGDYNLEKWKHFIPGKGGEAGLVPPFVNGVLAQIEAGEVEMCGFRVKAVRGPQESVMCLVVYRDGGERRFFGGVGGYGYDDQVPRIMKKAGKRGIPKGYRVFSVNYGYSKKGDTVGIDLESLEKTDKDDKGRLETRLISNWVSVPKSEELEAKWVGILPATVEVFRKFLHDSVDEFDAVEWYEMIKWEGLVRVNQGDAFFANSCGTSDNRTKPGKAKRPLIEKMVGK